jgi:hypothetical protein
MIVKRVHNDLSGLGEQASAYSTCTIMRLRLFV